jgi:uncharacterized protein YndB with AHSA1/START domain
MTPSTPSPSESSTSETAITASVRIAASPDVVFPYFTDSALAVKWIADAASLDARPGGTFSIDVRGNPARGEYLEIEPPHRVVFTWGIEGSGDLPPGTSKVEVVLQPDGDETVVTLTHRDLPTQEFRRSHREGWGEFLGLLGALLSRAP